MSVEHIQTDRLNKPDRQPYRVRLPGFISDKDIGLGDIVKRATSFVGLRPCSGCAKRAALFNSWIAFKGRNSNRSVP